jgi:ATP-dependent DNA helicase RecG
MYVEGSLMKPEEILQLIEKGENLKVEFKSWVNARSKKDLMGVLTKEAVALSNTSGGFILLGVEDDGDITGCKDCDLQNIIESIYDRTVPKLFTKIEEVVIKESIVFMIKVEKSSQLISTSSGEIFKRLGKNSKPMYPDEYSLNTISKTTKDFSLLALLESNEDDINFLEVYKLKERLKTRDPESTLVNLQDKAFLKDLGLIQNIDGHIKLNIAGLLFVGKDDAIKRLLPQAEVIYLHYNEKNTTEYDRRLDLKTTVLSTLDRLTQIIEDSNTIVNIQIGLFRIEVKDYPKHIFQEALLNAISHRDYTSSGVIYVKHYHDRLVIENPGAFPNGITIENIITHPSIARNKLIAETLQQLKYVQRAGQGVDIIFRDMLAFGKHMPFYTVYSDAVRLTLRNTLEDKEFVKFIVQEQDRNQKQFNTLEVIILHYLKDNKSINIDESIKLLQIEEQDIRTLLNDLISRGYLERNNRSYMFTKRVYDAFGENIGYIKDKTVDYIKAKRMILEYIEIEGYITNRKAQDLCGYDETKAQYTLKKMADESIITLIGKGRGSKYIKTEN